MEPEQVSKPAPGAAAEAPQQPAAAEQQPAARQGDVNAAALGQKDVKTQESQEEPKTPPENKGTRPGDSGGLLALLIPLAIMFAIFYLLLIRPQKRKDQERQEMVNRLKKEDKVVTIGGIIGVVNSLNEREVVLRLEDNAKVRVTRSAISRVLGEEKPE